MKSYTHKMSQPRHGGHKMKHSFKANPVGGRKGRSKKRGGRKSR
jgi:hypothetical protein